MSRNTKIFSICLMLAALAAAGCRDKDKKEGVLYQVGNGVITEQDAIMVGQSFPEPIQEQLMDRKGLQDLLDKMVSLELLYQEALKQKLDQEPAIKFRLERATKNYLAQEVVERSLRVEDLYSFFQDNFVRIDGIRIIVKPPGAETDRNAARATANAAYEALKNGADFSQVKRRNSPGENQELGYFSRSSVIKQFGADAAAMLFGMKQGDNKKFTTPVFVNNSFYIFYILEYPQDLDPKGYDMVWEEIAAAKREEIFRGLINDLRSQIPVKANEENLEKFLQVGDEFQQRQQNPGQPQPGPAPVPGGTDSSKRPEPGMTGQAAPEPNPAQPVAPVNPQPGSTPVK